MKKEKSTDLTLSQTNERRGMQRRDFFKILGSGIIIFMLPRCASEFEPPVSALERALPTDYNAFLRIAGDGTVSCYTGKIEMGQGINTSLVQMMADELNVPMEKINLVLGDTALCPWDGGTWGSLTTRAFGPPMRAALAEARGVLIQLASEKLNVPADQLHVNDGIISDINDPGKSISYGKLAKGKKIERYLDVKPSVEDYTKFTFVGKPFFRKDSELKVTGAAKFTGDLKIKGMVFARILRPPSYGAKLKSADTSDAEKIAGIQVVRDGDLVAVLHENQSVADSAIMKVKAEYDFEEIKVNHTNIFESMLKADTEANVAKTSGDLESGKKQSAKVFDSEFHDPFLAHAPIEPHTALAHTEGDKITVWASTQTPYPLQDDISGQLGYPLEKVRVIVPLVGGGFGGKSVNLQGVEAARLAKLSGKPVMLAWTRDEEFFYDHMHTAGVIKVKSGIDRSGFIKFWDYHVYYAGTRGADVLYDVPNATVTSYRTKAGAAPVHPFPTGPWRAPNNNTNTFARETQIDIMAASAGIDPLEFRLKNLKDQKMIDCLKAVADKFGYTPSKIPGGRGIGISLGTDAGTWVAMIAEVKVDKTTGRVQVVRVVCSQDMGLCVNPQGATIQMEGCISMGLGYTLTEEIKFEGGKLLQQNFDGYEIPRFSFIPKIETVILDRKDKAPQGGGEPAIITVGAAVGNAIFDATGARLYQMPFTPERVLEAMKKA
jgi:isoquinoline 1-oxidoreductase